MKNQTKFYVSLIYAAIVIVIASILFTSDADKWAVFLRLGDDIILDKNFTRFCGYTVAVIALLDIFREVLLRYAKLKEKDQRKKIMSLVRYLTPLVSAIFMFIMTTIIAGIIFIIILPQSWSDIYISIGIAEFNIPSMLAVLAGIAAGTYSFKASFNAKTGRLFRRGKK